MATVGYITGEVYDHERTDWDGCGPRPVLWAAWYPAVAGGPRVDAPVFDMGDVQQGGALCSDGPLPAVVLSHGTGGAPESLGWLARALAAQGYVVLAPRHHGNTGGAPYRAEGFLCWWERALDLSVLLSALAAQGPFAGRLDLSRAHAVGFSLGGYSVLALAGARTSMDQYLTWAQKNGAFAKGPREFPDAGDQVERLLDSSAPFRAAWARQGADFLDTRIRSVVALAPAPPVRGFLPQTVQSIDIPVALITGEADQEAPSALCADWLMPLNPAFQRFSAGDAVGHYTFLSRPAGEVPEDAARLFTDAEGVERELVHTKVADHVIASLTAT